MRVCILFSGGKDSTYTLHWAFLKGFNVECLITLKPRREDSWMFHYPAVEVTKLQAKALDIPQIFLETSGLKNVELEDLRYALKLAIERYKVKGVVTGALLSDYQRMNINMICEELGLKTYSPLWRKSQEEYMRDLVVFGFKFIITTISVEGLPPKFLGKVLGEDDIEEIIRLAHIHGFNPAFEGGEAETLVVDAPLFKKKLVVKGHPVRLGFENWTYIVESVELVSKNASSEEL